MVEIMLLKDSTEGDDKLTNQNLKVESIYIAFGDDVWQVLLEEWGQTNRAKFHP